MAEVFAMSMALKYVTSTIGSKKLMALTGLVWSGFVFGHMAGNLLMFVGPDAYNAYGHAIVSNPAIYAIEAVLVSMLMLHVLYALVLTIRNRMARPQRYARQATGPKATSPASKSMIYHGTVLLVFIVLHLITFKYGPYYETVVDGVKMRDLFRLIVEKFQSPIYVGWYVAALGLLGFHLSHGFASTLQSLGLNNSRFAPMVEKLGFGYAFLVCVGFISQPIFVFFFLK